MKTRAYIITLIIIQTIAIVFSLGLIFVKVSTPLNENDVNFLLVQERVYGGEFSKTSKLDNAQVTVKGEQTIVLLSKEESGLKIVYDTNYNIVSKELIDLSIYGTLKGCIIIIICFMVTASIIWFLSVINTEIILSEVSKLKEKNA